MSDSELTSSGGKRSIVVKPISSTVGQAPLVGTGQHRYGSDGQYTTVFMDGKDQVGTTMSHEAKLGSTISFHGVRYTVEVANKGCCKGKHTKEILKDINGLFRPGMNAILGPTGSGKSSLLDVLAGRKDPTGLSGTLLMDGNPVPDNFKCMGGYVVQDDVVMGTLTVRENLLFSATLRLPKAYTSDDKKRRVEETIQDLGLTDCADSKIGNEFIRGVSGGERKRTNIGMELIIAPPILFLDEPTTGLDASTANAVMLLLRRLALRGKTIIFSIHQPRYSIYRLFDSLMLLSQGEMVYHGASSEALQYFQSIGHICEEHNNPPDFFLDIINGDSTAVTVTADDQPNGILQQLSHHEEGRGTQPLDSPQHDYDGDDSPIHRELVSQFKKSTHKQRLHQEIDQILKEFEQRVESGATIVRSKINYATSFCTQLGAVSRRAVKNILRNPQTSILQIFVMVIFGLIVGAIYFQIESSLKSGVQNRVGAFFFIIMNQVFGNLSAVELFIKERAIFIHENASGFYRVSAYFLAKIFCDVIPMRAIPVAVFASITYWMIGFRPEVGPFFIYMLTLFLTTMGAVGISFIISASVKIYAIANLLIALCYVFMMLFSGLLVNLDDIADWLKWLKWFSIFRYGLDALSINELKDQEFCQQNDTSVCSLAGNAYLDSQGVAYGTLWDLWSKEVALAAISFISLLFAYIQLVRLKKLK